MSLSDFDGDPPPLSPPHHHTQLPNISMAAFHSQRLTETRGERERWLLCILRASLRTIPQDVLLSRAWTDAALTSAIQEHTHTHTHTHTHSVHPLLHIPPNPYTASLGIISQMFQSSGMLHLRVTGIPAIKNICFRGNHAEDFGRKSSNVRTCRNTNGGARV